MYVLYVYIYIPLHTYLYFSLPTILGEHVLPNSKGSRIRFQPKDKRLQVAHLFNLEGAFAKKHIAPIASLFWMWRV